MHLISFQKDKKKKQIIIVFSIGLILLVAGIIFYRTYSLFEETEEYDVIKEVYQNISILMILKSILKWMEKV